MAYLDADLFDRTVSILWNSVWNSQETVAAPEISDYASPIPSASPEVPCSPQRSSLSEDGTILPYCGGSAQSFKSGHKSRSAESSTSSSQSNTSRSQEEEYHQRRDSGGDLEGETNFSVKDSERDSEEANQKAEENPESDEYCDKAGKDAQPGPLGLLPAQLATYAEGLESTGRQFHISVTISDDQSVLEKVEERNLLALSDRTKVSNNPDYGQPPGGSIHALQDYQLQLMLLERQSKTRLLMARQMGDMIGMTTSVGKRPVMEPDNSDVLSENVPGMDIVELQDYIKRLQAKAKLLGAGKAEAPAPRYQTLYRILHEDVSDKGKLKTALSPPYFDAPEYVIGQRNIQVLRCSVPVNNFDLYLEQNKDISFIIYRTYVAPKNHGTADLAMSDKENVPPQINESIRPIAPHLTNALEVMLKSREEYAEMLQSLHSSSELYAPYLFMYHHRHALDTIRSGLDALSQEQLSFFSSYVAQSCGSEYATADTLISQGRILPEYVSYLFKPGDVLVQHRGDEYEGWIARSWPRPTHQERLPRAIAESRKKGGQVPLYGSKEALKKMGNDTVRLQHWSIEAWQWGFDGSFQRCKELLRFSIQSEEDQEKRVQDTQASERMRVQSDNQKLKEGGVAVKDLTVFPLQHADAEIVKKLRRRGRTFWKCRDRRFVSYRENDSNNVQSSAEERYMIDLKTYRSLHNNGYHSTLKDELGPDAMDKDEPPDEQFELLLPLRIKGYNLRRKKWYDLNADRISDVKWNTEAFSKVVIDRKAKDLTRALVEKQLAAEASTDLIAGKGNGLILLLHGSPGTGKTLTAESVAEICQKPLYRVTCGDVGTKAEDVEKYLESVFHLGKLWDCVVLLDEADVFLEQRSLEDLQRNALVSVFLRMLEYYEGILVLTSNRVGTFDEAFKSRIQLALHYPCLGPYQRLRIWENFIDRLESFKDDSIDIADLRDHLNDLKEEKMNGRQIRNAITTARQYAQWKCKTLTYEHLRDVIDVAGRFDKYLDDLHGGFDHDQLAEDEGLRLAI